MLELLFHHVDGNYGLGANPTDWNSFSSELNRVRRSTLGLVSEIERLRHLRIFSYAPGIDQRFLFNAAGEQRSEPINPGGELNRQFQEVMACSHELPYPVESIARSEASRFLLQEFAPVVQRSLPNDRAGVQNSCYTSFLESSRGPAVIANVETF